MTENEIGTKIIEAAIAVHRELGPGLLLNFGEDVLRTEITRCVNGLEEEPLCASAPLRETKNEIQPLGDKTQDTAP